MNGIIHLLVILPMLALAGCDPDRQPPLPYAVMPRGANMLGEILSHAGVEVMPPAGVSPENADRLAEALADALRERDIPALAGQKLVGAHRLQGEAKVESGAIVLNWLLYEPDGQELAGVEVRDALADTASADTPLPPDALQALTERAVAALVLHFPATGGNLEDDLRIFVPDITGVPGDGGTSLPLALRNALRAAGMSVAAQETAGAIRIEGEVRVSDQGAGQLVTLSWRVVDGAGAEIGRVEQSNPVPAGRLEGSWGEVAYDAASGAADGVVPLLEDYRSRTAGPAKE